MHSGTFDFSHILLTTTLPTDEWMGEQGPMKPRVQWMVRPPMVGLIVLASCFYLFFNRHDTMFLSRSAMYNVSVRAIELMFFCSVLFKCTWLVALK